MCLNHKLWMTLFGVDLGLANLASEPARRDRCGETALFALANPPQRQGFQPHDRLGDGGLSVPARRGGRPR
jgi:hypothetical protein